MIPNDKAFNGKRSFEYDNKTYHRFYNFIFDIVIEKI